MSTASEGILRPVEVRDLPALLGIHERQCKLLEKKLPFPDPSQPCVFQVAVVEVQGEVIGALFFEAEAEIQMIGTDPRCMAVLAANQLELENSLRVRNYRCYRAFVPKELVNPNSLRRLTGKNSLNMVSTNENYLSIMKNLY